MPTDPHSPQPAGPRPRPTEEEVRRREAGGEALSRTITITAPPFDLETMEPIEPPPGFYWPEDDDPGTFQLESLDPSPWELPQGATSIEDQHSWEAPELKLDD